MVRYTSDLDGHVLHRVLHLLLLRLMLVRPRLVILSLAPPRAAAVAVAAAVAPAAALAAQRVGDAVEQCLGHAAARGEGVRRPVAALQPVVAVARGVIGAAWQPRRNLKPLWPELVHRL
eukprot:scaffold17855_cov52-Phaeocystis_antarctica.AAC.2